ncbi:MAG: efflux RND transporter periplasmic adaptor subunit [Ignavibacteriaceae bacterium]
MKTFLIPLFVLAVIFTEGCGNGNEKNAISASGNIEATNAVVSSRVTGQVVAIKYDEGARVNEGDTVITIDHDNLEIQLKQAIAAENAADAQLKLLQEGARSEDIQQSEDAVKQSKINMDLAERDFNRMKQLYTSNTITKKQFDDAQAKYELTQAQYNSAQENLKKMKNFARPEEIKQARANLNRQKAAVDLLKKNISDSYVVSPITGFIVQKYVEKGETVSMLSSLFKVSELRIVKLVIYISEENLGRVKLGQKADVSNDTYKNKDYKGTVIYISPEAEFTPKNIQTKDERTKLVYAVKIEIKNPDFELKPGMPADAVIHL